jgi:hypothetical protein
MVVAGEADQPLDEELRVLLRHWLRARLRRRKTRGVQRTYAL